MPIRGVVKKSQPPPDGKTDRTGEYTLYPTRPEAYKPVEEPAPPPPAPFATAGIAASSTRDLNYFFSLAGSLYRDGGSSSSRVPSGVSGGGRRGVSGRNAAPDPSDGGVGASAAPAPPEAPPSFEEATAGRGAAGAAAGFVDLSALLVIWLFRQTATHVFPIAENFHLGPADRQPLYAVTAQPSIRSAHEFNELAVQRRDPIKGTWYDICKADIEPSLDLVKPGNWRVARLIMESIPVWKKVVSGQVMTETAQGGRGNTLRLSWGDRNTLGHLGDAYGLWWESGGEHGLAEAFYVVQGWRGFDNNVQGMVKVKPAIRDDNGQYRDPHHVEKDLAVLYFHADGVTPPQFVCADPQTQIRLDVIMSAMMTVLVIETRKAAVTKELGSLPAYGSNSHWSSKLIDENQGGVMGR